MAISNNILASFSRFLQELLEKKYSPDKTPISITVLDGTQRQVFTPDKPLITIGRAITNDIELNDRFVSREHAQIIVKNNQFYLKDLGSTNGSFLNKQHLEKNFETLLSNGDVIRIERFRLFIAIESPEKKPVDFNIIPLSVNQTPFSQFVLSPTSASITARFDILPGAGAFFMELDKSLVNVLRNRLHLSEPEKWVENFSHTDPLHPQLESIILDTLDFFEERFGKDLDFKLLFSGFQENLNQTSEWIQKNEQIILTVLKVSVGSNHGFMRLAFPARLKKLLREESAIKQVTAQIKARAVSGASVFAEKFERIKGLKTFLSMQIGTIKISPIELLAVEKEHILDFDDILVNIEREKVTGDVKLALPGTEGSYWLGHIIYENGKAKIKVKAVGTEDQWASEISAKLIDLPAITGAAPAEESFSQQITRSAKKPEKQATQLMFQPEVVSKIDNEMLSRISVPIEVELGRIKLSLSEIMALEPGQTIELRNPLTQSVELIVDNKLFAKGQLVQNGSAFAVKVTNVPSLK